MGKSQHRLEMGEEAWVEYQKQRKKEKAFRWKENHPDKALHVTNWRRRTKQKLIAYKGGKCKNCGYDKIEYPRAFSFHHRDPSQKEFGLSSKGITRKFDVLKKEVDKCDLLCVLCHAESHDELDGRSQIDISLQRIPATDKQCLYCQVYFHPQNNRQKFCSNKCRGLNDRTTHRPDKQTLLREIQETSYSAVGRKYGVSDNAIRKWLKAF